MFGIKVKGITAANSCVPCFLSSSASRNSSSNRLPAPMCRPIQECRNGILNPESSRRPAIARAVRSAPGAPALDDRTGGTGQAAQRTLAGRAGPTALWPTRHVTSCSPQAGSWAAATGPCCRGPLDKGYGLMSSARRELPGPREFPPCGWCLWCGFVPVSPGGPCWGRRSGRRR